ncbi:HD domain-containing protein [bacterium]|nr:HD domain-containing protein [bacterium]
MKIEIKNDEILNKIASAFSEEIYLVGGAVRDFLNNEIPTDRDLVVLNTDVREFAKKLCEFFDGTFIELDEENEIYRVVLQDKKNYLDITKPVGGTLENDLKSRDLTINSLAVNLKTSELIDVTGGLDDFKKGILRVFKEKSITDDPLRILRFYRFMAIYGFEIEPLTVQYAKKYKDLLNLPATERKMYELMRLFEGKYSDVALLKMDEIRILEQLFPFVAEYKKVPPNTHHHLDLFHHCIETVKQIQIIYENSSEEVKNHFGEKDFGQTNRLSHLKFAGFLHDIGKFSTWTIDDDGRHRFIKHDDVGSKFAGEFLKRNKFSKKQIGYLTKMIKYHIYPSSVMSAPEINDKVMMRFVRKMENDAVDIITLAKADRLSARGEVISDSMVENNISSLDKLQNFYLEKKDTLKPLEKLLSGDEIMKILNIKPSSQLGEIVSALHEAQISGDVTNKEEAVAFIKSFSKA